MIRPHYLIFFKDVRILYQKTFKNETTTDNFTLFDKIIFKINHAEAVLSGWQPAFPQGAYSDTEH
jgi:hypothetical protein